MIKFKIVADNCTVYTKVGATEAVLVTHGGQPEDRRTLTIPARMTLKYYGRDGDFKKVSFNDIIQIVDEGYIGFWAELCTWGAIVPDYEFEPYELRDPRPDAPEADDFWGGAKSKWPIILPTKRTRLSKVLKMLKENNLSYDTLHCFHCRVSVETMKSWHTTASIVG